ncbi:GNAT family N-acetyltransferase [Ekhidna sp.]|uniref:GNAT family N-acetyltransferase n=1 Tax=Ekhidna sp. TaxID=2608089 RepID=UPI0035129BE8
MNYLTTPLSKSHKKSEFSCGNQLLDSYLHKQAGQDVKRKLSACFILSDESNIVKGYYTLSSSSIERTELPEEIIKILPPSYENLPVTLLGRLARNVNNRGEGIGETLLLDALKRSYDTTSTVASMAVVVDPIDQAAVEFYGKYGFVHLPSSGKMFITMKTVSKLF